MVGTTRSRVSFFLNRFRKLGYIDYDVGPSLHVRSSLLRVVLDDDNGRVLTRPGRTSHARTKKAHEPPAEPGEAPDRERARTPPLPRFRPRGR
jgi:hypothetical protein